MKNVGITTAEERGMIEKFFNFRPVFFAGVFLCLGIVFAFGERCYGLSALWLLLWFPCVGVALCFCRTKRRLTNALLGVVLLGMAFFVGVFSFHQKLDKFSDAERYEGHVVVAGRVVEKEKISYGIRVYLTDVNVDGNRVDGKLVAYLPYGYYDELQLSDEVLLQGEITTDTAYFDEYGFRASAIRENTVYTITSVDECRITGNAFDVFLAVRQRAERVIRAGLDESPAEIALGVLFGQTSGIESGLYENMRFGGIAHIFAVSGLHIGALFGFCMLLMRKTVLRKAPKPVRFLLVSGLLLFYAGICGFSPSVVRATVLCLTGYFGTLLSTRTDFLQSLGAGAIVILLLDPTALFNVGFQLSFLSCLGITLLARPLRLGMDCLCAKIRSLFPKKLSQEEREALESGDTLPPNVSERIRRLTVGALSVSLSAQIFTAPVCLWAFGYVSGSALLLNVLFVPIFSVVFVALLSVIVVACCLPVAVGSVVLYVFNVLVFGMLLLFEAVDFSAFAITGLQIPIGGYICYYGCCIFCTDKWNLHRAWRVSFALLFASSFILTLIVGKIS